MRTRSTPALRRLLAVHAVNRGGDYLYNVALVVYVYGATSSTSWVAAVSIARLVPAVALAPLGGLLADSFDRRRLIVVCDLLAALVMTWLAVQVSLGAPIGWWLPLAALLAVAATSPARPAMTALLGMAVPPDRRAAANSSIGVVENVAVVVGPALGAVVFLLGPQWVAFAVDAVSFAVGARMIATLRMPATRTRPTAGRTLRHQTRAGLRAVAGSGIRGILGWTALCYFVCGVQIVVVAPLSRGPLGTGSWGVGAIEAAVGVGGVLAALLLRHRPRPAGTRCALPAGVAVAAAALGVLSGSTATGLACLAACAIGIGVLVVDVAGTTQLMSRVPTDLLGCVDGVLGAAAVAALAAGNALAGVLVGAGGLVAGTVWCMLPPAALAAVATARAVVRGRRPPVRSTEPETARQVAGAAR